MMSGFKFTSIQFDIKNPVDVKFDLSCLTNDGKTRKVAVRRMFDVQKDGDTKCQEVKPQVTLHDGSHEKLETVGQSSCQGLRL